MGVGGLDGLSPAISLSFMGDRAIYGRCVAPYISLHTGGITVREIGLAKEE